MDSDLLEADLSNKLLVSATVGQPITYAPAHNSIHNSNAWPSIHNWPNTPKLTPFMDSRFSKETFLTNRDFSRTIAFDQLLELITKRYDAGYSFISFRYNDKTEDTNFKLWAYPILQSCVDKLQASDFNCIIEEEEYEHFNHKVTVFF